MHLIFLFSTEWENNFVLNRQADLSTNYSEYKQQWWTMQERRCMKCTGVLRHIVAFSINYLAPEMTRAYFLVIRLDSILEI